MKTAIISLARTGLALAGLSLAGCQQVASVANPDIAQLARFQAANASPQAIAGETVVPTCGPDTCARLYAAHGVANLQLAMADRAAPATCPPPSPAAQSQLDAAIHDLGKALADLAGIDQAGQTRLWRDKAQALYCRAEQDRPASGLTFAVQAESAAQRAEPPAGNVLAGWAALYVAVFAPDASTRCDAAARAKAAAESGLKAGPDAASRAALTRIGNDARQSAAAAGCPLS
ncbi:hypothetical protein [Rhodopila sp.]|jgi:hypothetical protein|uniref:hypothetical protein n=1 Tax=Rhodopila sp. TaxID=2480087 RepID=UPI002C6C6A22|nr:hypothetical protein [Rhodopila sp.]HVZ10256.1 hypothetical protein [Rhodopila sp.]